MKKFRFNLFDVLILLVIVALIFGASSYVKGTGRVGGGNSGGAEIQFTVLLTEKSEFFAGIPSEGDFVRFGNYEAGEENSGVVVSVQKTQSTRHVENLIDGGYKESPIEGMYDVAITVKGTGFMTGDVVKIGTTEIRTGETFFGKSLGIKSRKPYKIEGYVINVDYKG